MPATLPWCFCGLMCWVYVLGVYDDVVDEWACVHEFVIGHLVCVYAIFEWVIWLNVV